VDVGAKATGDGAALAGGDRVTESPSTIVTVRGAELPEKSATLGYPVAVHVDVPELVTVMTPVMVPAAPCDWPADAVM